MELVERVLKEKSLEKINLTIDHICNNKKIDNITNKIQDYQKAYKYTKNKQIKNTIKKLKQDRKELFKTEKFISKQIYKNLTNRNLNGLNFLLFVEEKIEIEFTDYEIELLKEKFTYVNCSMEDISKDNIGKYYYRIYFY